MTPTLDGKLLVLTAEKIRDRIARRFPDAGLKEVVAEAVVNAARDASERAAEIARPARWLHAGLAAIAVVAAAGVAAYFAAGTGGQSPWKAALEFLDAAKANAAILTALGVFLWTLETRAKRRRALRAVHELRALAHLVDMHQLTKDPTRLDHPTQPVEVAGELMGAESMRLYLHYCTELLAVASKLGQLYVQDFPDPAAVAAVDQFEALASGLSSKVWQKLMILDRVQAGTAAHPGAPQAEAPALPLDELVPSASVT